MISGAEVLEGLAHNSGQGVGDREVTAIEVLNGRNTNNAILPARVLPESGSDDEDLGPLAAELHRERRNGARDPANMRGEGIGDKKDSHDSTGNLMEGADSFSRARQGDASPARFEDEHGDEARPRATIAH